MIFDTVLNPNEPYSNERYDILPFKKRMRTYSDKQNIAKVISNLSLSKPANQDLPEEKEKMSNSFNINNATSTATPSTFMPDEKETLSKDDKHKLDVIGSRSDISVITNNRKKAFKRHRSISGDDNSFQNCHKGQYLFSYLHKNQFINLDSNIDLYKYAFLLACKNNDVSGVEYLIDLCNNNKEQLKALLNTGISENGETPLAIANKNNYQDIIQLLKRAATTTLESKEFKPAVY